MNTPTLPRIDVGDAWSSGVDRVHDLASAAVEAIEEVPERALALAGTVIPALRPARRSRRPFVFAGLAVAAALAAFWLLRSRRAPTVISGPAAREAAGTVSAAS